MYIAGFKETDALWLLYKGHVRSSLLYRFGAFIRLYYVSGHYISLGEIQYAYDNAIKYAL